MNLSERMALLESLDREHSRTDRCHEIRILCADASALECRAREAELALEESDAREETLRAAIATAIASVARITCATAMGREAQVEVERALTAALAFGRGSSQE